MTARLIVRRVRDLNQKAAAGPGELFTAWRYHAVFTDSPFTLVQAEEKSERQDKHVHTIPGRSRPPGYAHRNEHPIYTVDRG